MLRPLWMPKFCFNPHVLPDAKILSDAVPVLYCTVHSTSLSCTLRPNHPRRTLIGSPEEWQVVLAFSDPNVAAIPGMLSRASRLLDFET